MSILQRRSFNERLQYLLLNWDQLFSILVLEYFLACSPSPILSKIVEIEHFALAGVGHLVLNAPRGWAVGFLAMGGGRWEKFLRLLPNRPPPGNRLFTLSISCHFLSTHSQGKEMYCSVAHPSLVSIYLFTFVCLFVLQVMKETDGRLNSVSYTRDISWPEHN